MKRHQQSKFASFFLRAIDALVSFYMQRPIHWEKEPFEKATKTQWRIGWFFVACIPVFMLVFAGNNHAISFLGSAADGRRSVAWLYIAFIGLASVVTLGWLKIGPKTPLYVSIPTAIVAWVYCIWLLGFHSEKIIHSPS